MKELAKLLQTIPPSATIAVNDKASALKAAGHDIISLGGGDPNFSTPVHIVDAAVQALRAGDTHYPAPSRGTTPLLEAIAAKMEVEQGLILNPKSDIVVTPGSKWALNLALQAILNPGDGVLYFEPVWVSYPSMIRLAGGVPQPVSLDAGDYFTITADKIRASLTPNSKAIMVNSPSNPTGRVLRQEEVDAIIEVILENDLYLITDEVYDKLVYDGRQVHSFVADPRMVERTVITNGLSKAYAMTGWRLGWLVGPTPILKLAAKLHTQTVTSAASFTMAAATAALTGPQDIIEYMRLEYKKRRDFMVKALNEMEGVVCPQIEGAFYLFTRFPDSKRNSLELAEYLLEGGVAATPGIAFGSSGEKHLRFTIAVSQETLEEAVERLHKLAVKGF